MAAMKLEVSMIQASGLKHLNMTGDSIYCHCEVQHHDHHAHKVKCETQPQKGLDPVWNELFEIEPWHEGEALEFTIYDKGMLTSKVEGKVVLPSEYFYPNGFEGQVQISGLEHAALYVVIRPMGMEGQAMEGQHYQQELAMQPEGHMQSPFMEGPPQKLQVTIMNAVGLKHMNHFTGDSPYVVCEVEHVNKHEKHKPCKFQTKAVKGLDPVWNETKELDPWHAGEALKFTVLDKGLMGSKSEGVVSVPSELFYPNGFEGPITIPNKEHSQLLVRIVPMGPSTVDLQLDVTIIQANNLKHLMHFTGDTPYVTCSVKHTKSRSKAAKIQTKSIKHGADPLDPVFDETHMLGPWTWDEPLEFCVYDKGLLGSKSEGKVTLAAEHFYPMGFEGMLPLDGCPEATLAVRIIPAGPWSATSTATTAMPGQLASAGAVTHSAPYRMAPMSPASYVSAPQPIPYSPAGVTSASSLPPQPVMYAAPASMTFAPQPMAQPMTYAAPSSMTYVSPALAAPTSAPAAAPSLASMTMASPTYTSSRSFAAPSLSYKAPAVSSTYAAVASQTASVTYKASQPAPTSYALPSSSMRAPLPAAAPVMYASPAAQSQPMVAFSTPMAQQPPAARSVSYAAPSMGYVAAPQVMPRAARGDLFSQLDTNRDGVISRAEFQAMR